MSDAQLAARLGVRPCERVSDTDPWCQVHDCIWRSGSRLVCDAVLDDLDLAERGMDLVTPILTDLIAELRAKHSVRVTYVPKGPICNGCGKVLPCDEAAIADRAESRLQEVVGDE